MTTHILGRTPSSGTSGCYHHGTSTSTLFPYPHTWKMTRDKEGHRTYTLTYRVVSDAPNNDGPFTVLNTDGVFQPGAIWDVGNDRDVWAWCTGECTVTPDVEGEASTQWTIEQTFSTELGKRPMDFPIGNPVLEPPYWDGGSSKFTQEAVYDRYGFTIINSAFEQIRGQNVEFEVGGKTHIKVVCNVQELEAGFWASVVDTVNDSDLWGCFPRTVRLSAVTWERKIQAVSTYYFTVTFEFEVWIIVNRFGELSSGWDRDLLDEGNKCLNGHWGTGKQTHRFPSGEGYDWVLDPVGGQDPDYNNPGHFIRFTDRNGQAAHCVLNGVGVPISTGVAGVQQVTVCTLVNFVATVGMVYGIDIEGYVFTYTILTTGDTVADVLNALFAAINLDPDDEGFVPENICQATSVNTGAGTITLTGVGNSAFSAKSAITQVPGSPSPTTQFNCVITVQCVPTVAVGPDGGAGNIHVEKYQEYNFLLLTANLPTGPGTFPIDLGQVGGAIPIPDQPTDDDQDDPDD